MSSLLLSLSPAKRGSQGLETEHLIPPILALSPHLYVKPLILALAQPTGSYTLASPHLLASLQVLDNSCSLFPKGKLDPLAISKHGYPVEAICLTHCPTGKLLGQL